MTWLSHEDIARNEKQAQLDKFGFNRSTLERDYKFLDKFGNVITVKTETPAAYANKNGLKMITSIII